MPSHLGKVHTISWWHLEQLAVRLQELLPAQLELDLDPAVEAAERAVGAAERPHAPSRPTGSLRAAPGPSQPVQHHGGAQGSGRRDAETGQGSPEEPRRAEVSELDLALWPLLWGPDGCLSVQRGRRRL